MILFHKYALNRRLLWAFNPDLQLVLEKDKSWIQNCNSQPLKAEQNDYTLVEGTISAKQKCDCPKVIMVDTIVERIIIVDTCEEYDQEYRLFIQAS